MSFKGRAVHIWSENSVKNCSTTVLASGATFTGDWADMDGFSSIVVSCRTDQAGTLYLEQSLDGVTVDSTLTAEVNANVKETQKIVPTLKYYRTKFTNTSASAQTIFRLQTRVGNEVILSSLLSSQVQSDASAIVVRTIEAELSLVSGKFQGISTVNKFGTNSDINSVPEDIWEGGSTYTGFPISTLETLAISSSDNTADNVGGTGALTVRVIGLDSNYDVISETVTLTGSTPVNTVQQFRRAHTMSVITAGSNGVNAGVLTVTHSTTTTNVFLKILAGRNQSNCSAYTVPAGYTAYMRFLHAAIRGGQANASVDGFIWTRSFGGVFRSRRPFTAASAFRLADQIYGGLVFTEKSDIILRISAQTGNNISVNGGYDLILVKN